MYEVERIGKHADSFERTIVEENTQPERSEQDPQYDQRPDQRLRDVPFVPVNLCIEKAEEDHFPQYAAQDIEDRDQE